MALFIVLSIASLTGMVYGIIRKNKKLAVASIIVLILIVIILLGFSYLYSKNPY